MQRPQFLAILVAFLFLCGLFFGLTIKPPKSAEIERARITSTEDTKILSILSSAKKTLSATDHDLISLMEEEYKVAEDDGAKIESLKKLSGTWFSFGNAAVAGHFAEKVAELENSAQAWSIAGSSHGLNLEREQEQKLRDYRRERAVKSFEKAVSLEPNNTDHRLNMALTYVSHPLEENPMKGVLMLIELNKANPNDEDVLFHLGRLSIQTGQWDRAALRLERADSIRPNQRRVVCALAEVYEQTGSDKLKKYTAACKAMNAN